MATVPDSADWKVDPDDNALVDGSANTDVAENNLPKTINNAIRGIQSAIVTRHRVVQFFDDFLAGAIEGRISSTGGSGANTQAATVVAGSLNGTITLTTSDADDTHAANSTNLTLDDLNFQAGNGGMTMEARIAVDDITAVAIFVGFTDVISTTVELPIFLNAADLDSDAANACGVIFDTDATTDEWCHGGVKANTDTTPAFSGTAPVNDTYVIVRVEVSAAGAVQGFINGTAIGAAVADAVTTTTPLTPCIVVSNRSAAQRVLTVDYIYAQQSRA